jgi:hypothetical protein
MLTLTSRALDVPSSTSAEVSSKCALPESISMTLKGSCAACVFTSPPPDRSAAMPSSCGIAIERGSNLKRSCHPLPPKIALFAGGAFPTDENARKREEMAGDLGLIAGG